MFHSQTLRRQRFKPHRLQFHVLTALSLSLLTLLLFLFFAHFHHFLAPPSNENPSSSSAALLYLYHSGGGSGRECDIYDGQWVFDGSYLPFYSGSSCPFVEQGFRCQENGRSDTDYLKWRWKPHYCDIPRFDAGVARKRLKGLRVAFIGDSMGRTQWESFVCLLMSGMANRSSVYEVNNNNITKTRSYLAARFESDNITVEYFRSPYLVSEGSPPKHAPKRVRTTLKLDKIEASAARWRRADVLVFNTGHWWTGSKTFERGCYFQVGNSLRLGMNIETAFGKALSTWASWVETEIDFKRTKVFFRSFEPAHWEGTWKERLCPLETKPALNSTFPEDFPHVKVLRQVVGRSSLPVIILNITSLSSYRRDSHLGNWTQDSNNVDCGHWCLPGLPDIWNELFYASLLLTTG